MSHLVKPGFVFPVPTGPYAGRMATVVDVSGLVSAELSVDDRTVTIVLEPEEVETANDDPRPAFRAALERDLTAALMERFDVWWSQRLDDEDAHDRYRAYVDEQRAELVPAYDRLQAELELVFTDAAIAEHGVAWARARFHAEAARWLPASHADLITKEERAVRRRKVDEARERARRKAELRRRAVRKLGRRAGLERAAAVAERLRSRVRATHGLELPDHLFTFLGFLESLDDRERAAWDRLGLRPVGILDPRYLDGAPTRDGLDPRLHHRLYRDPPELLTILEQGLRRFGLLCHDPAHPAEFGDYRANEFATGFSPEPTVLSALRTWLEVSEQLIRDERRSREETGQLIRDERRSREETGQWASDDDAAARIEILRDALLDFETEEGEETSKARGKDRIATVDGAGAIAPPSRLAARDDPGLEVIRRAILSDDPVVASWIDAALEAAAAGEPGGALALGRDLHWLSAYEPHREKAATRLLVSAYEALGRRALAEITRVHHGHRGLERWDVYDLP